MSSFFLIKTSLLIREIQQILLNKFSQNKGFTTVFQNFRFLCSLSQKFVAKSGYVHKFSPKSFYIIIRIIGSNIFLFSRRWFMKMFVISVLNGFLVFSFYNEFSLQYNHFMEVRNTHFNIVCLLKTFLPICKKQIYA